MSGQEALDSFGFGVLVQRGVWALLSSQVHGGAGLELKLHPRAVYLIFQVSPTYSVSLAVEVLKWVKQIGPAEALNQHNQARSMIQAWSMFSNMPMELSQLLPGPPLLNPKLYLNRIKPTFLGILLMISLYKSLQR